MTTKLEELYYKLYVLTLGKSTGRELTPRTVHPSGGKPGKNPPKTDIPISWGSNTFLGSDAIPYHFLSRFRPKKVIFGHFGGQFLPIFDSLLLANFSCMQEPIEKHNFSSSVIFSETSGMNRLTWSY